MLSQTIRDLERAENRLLVEEKLAAVGRFSSAIAHEIRNPVAMISSALSTALHGNLDDEQRSEMFEIAAMEATRLEKLTDDFLLYARPRDPQRAASDVVAILEYIAGVCRIRAAEKEVVIKVEGPDELIADIDAEQTDQALLNLVTNAVDAAPQGGTVTLRAAYDHAWVRIDVDNESPPISPEVVDLIFEPFFTTKPKGTGLGLAIARNFVRAQGGDLVFARNELGLIRFSISLPATRNQNE